MHAAEFYTGIVPDVYAALRGTHFGTERYRAFVHQYGAPVLELGCGDDGPFFDLVSEGFDIEGVDSSLDMIRRARRRLEQQGLTAPTHHQRMENLDLGRRFGSTYLAGPTFNLLSDDLTASHALRAIARHLTPEGAALVPLWTPRPTPADQIGVVRTAEVGGAVARYIVESEDYDVDERTRTSRVRYELGDGTEVVVEHREWIIHWYEDDRFRQLAADAGLSVSFTAIDEEQVEATLRRR